MRVLGTAGHVDHGKSTLVRRLTGIDPDRLAEEKAREMTIDLGFAWWTTPSGEVVGIVDVPGHRDFIENMLAGVGGISAVLLVIAADEGVMPQTREHLAILDLLGVQHGLVVLTKIDMVDDPDWLELVAQDVTTLLLGTALQGAPILPVSARTGAGIASLEAAIEHLLQETPVPPNTNQPRLPIDRVFAMSGFGTVVTGTLLGGSLRLGDEVALLPSGVRGRVRGLQRYRTPVETASPGSRLAVNISGVDKNEVKRGDVLTYPGQIHPTQLADIRFRHLPDVERALRHNAQVKFFAGTAETTAFVRLLDAETLPPGAEGWLQVRLDSPLALTKGERVILRYPSPSETIGGGIVVNVNPTRRWKRFNAEVIARLELQMQGSPAERIAQAAENPEPLKRQTLQQRYHGTDFADAATAALDEGLLVSFTDGSLWAATSLRAVQQQIMDIVRQYHTVEPLRLGIPREEVRSRVGLKNNHLGMVLDTLPELWAEGALIRLRSHTIRFNERQQTRIETLMSQIAANPYTPPSYDIAVSIVGENVLRALIDLGEIVQMATMPEVIFARPTYEQMKQQVLTMIDTHGSIDAKAVRDLFNASRKYAIGLLEHLDASGITRRDGDNRVRAHHNLRQNGVIKE